MTGSEKKIENSVLAYVLKEDQHEQRHEDEQSFKRETELDDRLIEELTKRRP